MIKEKLGIGAVVTADLTDGLTDDVLPAPVDF
jgi:recombination protein RecA